MDLRQFSAGVAVKLFLIGMLAVSAMFLPGISGSTLLLVFGAYVPVINAVKDILTFDFSCLPAILCFGGGILIGAATVVKAVKLCLERYRTQTVYLILGMLTGSFYAVAMGPATLKIPQKPLDLGNFSAISCIVGIALVWGLHLTAEGHRKAG